MKYIGILSLIAVCSCSQVPAQEGKVNSVDVAREYVGLHEVKNRKELVELLDIDPVRTEWCAAFVNAVLQAQGVPNLHDIDSRYPLLARSFLEWGNAVDFEDEVRRGDVIVFPRGNEGWQGHVGFYVGNMDDKWIILGGNQDNTVSYKLYYPWEAIGRRRAEPN